jgi:hypothetical protein
MALYEAAVRRGLPSNVPVLKELPFLSELHKVHYARYPQIEVKAVPAHMAACVFAVHFSGKVVIEQMLRYALVAIA